MAEALAATVIERHRKRLRGRARLITLDLDPTEDPTHGAQQLTFFNWHYDTYCYLSMVGFLTFNHEVEQYLVTAVLRPGNAPGLAGAVGLLRRLIERLTKLFRKPRCGCAWMEVSQRRKFWIFWTASRKWNTSSISQVMRC